MWKAIGGFFKGFFGNIAADPVSTLKGAVSLASAAATCHGMATGKVPVNEMTIGVASALTTNGIHALGTNTATGVTLPAAAVAIDTVDMAASATPTVMGAVDQLQAAKAKADAGHGDIAAYAELAASLAGIISASGKSEEVKI